MNFRFSWTTLLLIGKARFSIRSVPSVTTNRRRQLGLDPYLRNNAFEHLEARRMLYFPGISEHAVGVDLFQIKIAMFTELGDTYTRLNLGVSHDEGTDWLDVNGEHVRELDTVSSVTVIGSELPDSVLASTLTVPLTVGGNEGDDNIVGGTKENTFYGGSGADTLTGGPAHDSLSGDEGDDIISGGLGDDGLDGGAGRDVLRGGDDDDHLADFRNVPCVQIEDCESNFSQPDVFDGGSGNDDILILLNDDVPAPVVVDGGSGDDTFQIEIQQLTPDLTMVPGDGDDHLYLFLARQRGNTALFSCATDQQHNCVPNSSILSLNDHQYALTGLEQLDLTGGSQADTITIEAVPIKFLIEAEAGDDVIDASIYSGNLYVFGDVGNDTILGGTGDDELFGSWDNDTVRGGPGNDRLYGGDGSDHLWGEGGYDKLFGSVDLQDNRDISIDFDAGNDADFLSGGDDGDHLSGGQGSDTLFGDAGDDFLYGFWSPAVFDENGAILPPNLYLDGEDRLNGGSGDDELRGYDAADTYIFDAEGSGADKLYEVPDDVLNSGVDGRISNDSDTLDFSELSQGVNLDLADIDPQGQAYAPGRKLTLNGAKLFENVIGSSDGDRIRGNSRVNHLEGRDGSDILVGEGDDGFQLGQGDWLEGGSGGDVLVGDGFDVDVTAWTRLLADFSSFVASGSLLFNVDLKPTGTGGDVLESGDGDALIIGGAGNDTINAGVGRALIFGDAIRFTLGAGEPFAIGLKGVIDDLSLSSFLFSEGGGLSLLGEGNDLIHGGSGGTIAFGGDGDDWIWGQDDSSADFLFGNNGEDHVLAGDGFNFVVGGAGDDPELAGGGGFDIIIGDSLKMPDGSLFTAPKANLLSGAASILQKLANLFSVQEETVDGNIIYKDKAFGFLIVDSGDDKIRGGDGVNLLFGGPGHDTITGGQDEDVIYGGDGNDSSLNGVAGVDLIVGGPGDDTLRGGTDNAANFLFGDILTVDLGFDLTPLLNGDFKSLVFPRIEFDLAGAGNDHIYGANGFDFIVGGNGVDEIWGQSGEDIGCNDPQVTCENNNIVFGDDFSTIAKLFSLASDFFGILTNPTSSISTIVNLAKSLYTFFVGSEGDAVDNGDTYEGGNGYDIVLGGDGVDTLNGAGGSDFLIGGYGDDVLDVGDGEQVEPLTILFGTVKIDEIGWGGHGNDVFHGGTGNDALMSDEGTDTFYGADGDDVLAGGGDDDMLFGESGNDWLYGEDGNDLLDGGAGADHIYAGPGSDTVIFDPDDQVDDPADRLPGDTNLDGRVDLADLNNVRNNFGAVGAGVQGDANDDGRVDLQDLNAVRNNFGASGSGTPMLRKREPAIEKNREQLVLERSRQALDRRRIGGRVDDLVFGIDGGLFERPLSVVDNQLARVIRRRGIRTT